MKPNEIDEGVKVWMAHVLKMIFMNDKTEYNYGYGKKSLTRFGKRPGKGKIFKTPAEIASETLRALGYNSPYDIVN